MSTDDPLKSQEHFPARNESQYLSHTPVGYQPPVVTSIVERDATDDLGLVDTGTPDADFAEVRLINRYRSDTDITFTATAKTAFVMASMVALAIMVVGVGAFFIIANFKALIDMFGIL